MQDKPRDHGGDLDRAKRSYGEGRWLDLSTGINPVAYPVPPLPPHAFNALPTPSDVATLEDVAAQAYGTEGAVVALAGAQAAIQLVPRLRAPGQACVVGPTYNEHAAALEAQGWQVTTVTDPEEGVGADLLTLVNPNNPDGRHWDPDVLDRLRGRVGLLVVDESFGDVMPERSLAPRVTDDADDVVVLRSFGKFYGLAGLRLGFAICGTRNAGVLRSLAGPWSVSGPAIAAGCAALADAGWAETTRARLAADAARLDAMAVAAGWTLVGGTTLFRTYATADASAVQQGLARDHVWTRVFPYSRSWIRLGLPGTEEDWAQLERAMARL